MQIILASRSPRRKKALRQIVARFRTLAVPEPKKAQGKSLVAKTRYLALAKAKAAARMLAARPAREPRAKAGAASGRSRPFIIIAADTLASCRGKVMGKPKDAAQARAMLEKMSGQKLKAVTSIAIGWPQKKRIDVWTQSGWVRFRKLERERISRYLSSGQWRGKAAAVNVEEKPVRDWIEKKGGEQGAVIGLPLKRLRLELGKCCHAVC